MNDSERKAVEILHRLVSDPELGRFVDGNLPIPKAYCGTGEIRLIILGQDPTVKNPLSRAKINTVLNLDRKGSLRAYLDDICQGLGLDLDRNVYATNYLKNFFVAPPTQIDQEGIFTRFAQVWLPFLREELAHFGNAPVIALGEPVLSIVLQGDAPKLVREYWGYSAEWRVGKTIPFRYVKPADNVLSRVVFPFPHQPSITKRFYYERLQAYVKFVRSTMASGAL